MKQESHLHSWLPLLEGNFLVGRVCEVEGCDKEVSISPPINLDKPNQNWLSFSTNFNPTDWSGGLNTPVYKAVTESEYKLPEQATTNVPISADDVLSVYAEVKDPKFLKRITRGIGVGQDENKEATSPH